MKICYSILHYKTYEDTIECINSIIQSNDNYEIVVVDNFSNDGSIEIIEKYCLDKPNIHIIKSEKNLGFASGNNIGYKYARNALKSDFIALSNNDIIVENSGFSDGIISAFKEEAFYVMGPDIESLIDGGHQNPKTDSLTSKKAIIKQLITYKLLLFISKIGLYDIIKKNKKVRTGSTRKDVPSVIVSDVTLHGSFVVFSPLFIEKEEIAFREGTFMYCEEALLRHYCNDHNYSMIFYPNLKVLHKEDSATNSLNYSTKEKREFVFKNMIQSLRVCLNYLNGKRKGMKND